MALTDLESGTTVGDRYRVERFLGQGELGCTYVCRDLMEAETPVALRILTGWDGSAGATALRQELSFLGRLKHPHLAHLLDFGVTGHDSTPYLVRHFVEGVDFFRGSEGWSIDQILHYLVRLCRVLQYLHSRGAVHRHLKPSNVMLTGGAGSEPELKVLDFGLDRKMKRSRRNLPVLAYTAPEILLGHSQNPRADLYSLGILAYQLLTRRLPFDDEDEGYLIQKHLQGKADMRPIERLERGAGLAQVLLALLEKDPEKRPSSAEDVIRLVSAASGRDYSGTVSESVEAYFTAGPFVGREKEMACLQERATRVRESSRGCTVFLTGESGSGKSRCLEELRTWALLEGWRVVEAACLPREDRSYGPYRRILARASVLRPAQSDDLGEKAIFRFDDASRLAESPQIELSSGSAAGPFRDLLTREVVRLLAGRPTLLFLHDFHWADEATVAVLDYLTSDILAHPIFMCVSLRPGETEQGPLRRLMELSVRQLRAETLSLEALPPQAIEDLIAGITGQASLGREIGSWVHKASGGNPFFVEEILKHLIDRALLRRELGKWRLSTERFENVEVPSSVAVVLRHRLAQLSAGAAALTEWLALFRRAVSKEELRALSSLSSEELEARLRELILRQIIREVSGGSDGCFEFRHALISEVITEDLPTGRRRRMHQKIGQVLEQQFGDQENLQELATHFMEGKCVGKAMNYALRAAKACKAEFANESALRFYEYALGNKRFLSADQLCEVAIDAADTYCAVGNPKRAIQILEAQLRSVGKRGGILTIRLYTQLSRSFQFLGVLNESERAAKHGMRLLRREPLDSNRETAETLLLSQLAFCMGNSSQPRKALAMLKRSSCFQAASRHTLAAGHLYILISGLCWVACDFGEGEKAARTAIQILETLNAVHLLPMAYSHLAMNLAGMGKLGKALDQQALAVSTAKRTRSPFLLTQALCNLTESYCRSGQFAEASENSAQVIKVALETENRNLASTAILCLLESQIATAEWAAAYKTRGLLTSRDIASLPVYAKALAMFLSASLNVELGCFDSALSDLDELDLLASSETPIMEVGLGKVLRAKIYSQQGRIHEAIALLERLEITDTQRRWAYQLTIVKLQLAQVLLMTEEWQKAFGRARDSLRLARAMPALHLEAQAHYLLGKIALLQAERLSSPESSWRLRQPTDGDVLLKTAYSELQTALMLSADRFVVEIAWRAHHMMMRFCQMTSDLDNALSHAQETSKLLSLVESRVPTEALDHFRKIKERNRAKSECESLVQDFLGKCEQASVSISEMEEEHLRMLFRVSSLINSIRDLNQLMDAIVNLLAKAVGMERILIALREEKTGGFKMARKMNLEVDSLDALDPLSQQVLQEVARSGSPFVTANARCDPRIMSKELTGSYAGTFFCAPLTACGRMMGLLYADHRLSRESLSESTINLFAAFCNLAAVAIDNALVHRRLMHEKSELEQYVRQVTGEYPELVGKSAAMQKLRERIALAAASPLDVLIYGESGTGKELVARALHRTGRRSAGKFVALDCGSLSDSLVESELFGYRKGAFTGAVENRAGLLEAADGGVIFLDEISNLSLRLQRKLLRVLQEREVRRIGETAVRRINVQVIAATNKDLRQEIRAGRFRKDLYFRLNAMEINVPPLRDRTEDVPLLLEWFLDQVGRSEGGRTRALSQEAHALLMQYSYPGNVRELKNIVEGSYYSTPGDIIEIGHLPAVVRDGEGEAASWEPAPAVWQVFKRIRDGQGRFDDLVKTPFLERQIGSGQVRQVIHLALAETGGRYRDAFRLLGIPAREYAIVIQFLKRNRCYLDFRPYRKSRH
jgi:Nif-specific regulatory protein